MASLLDLDGLVGRHRPDALLFPAHPLKNLALSINGTDHGQDFECN
jgi:hypothetical protein